MPGDKVLKFSLYTNHSGSVFFNKGALEVYTDTEQTKMVIFNISLDKIKTPRGVIKLHDIQHIVSTRGISEFLGNINSIRALPSNILYTGKMYQVIKHRGEEGYTEVPAAPGDKANDVKRFSIEKEVPWLGPKTGLVIFYDMKDGEITRSEFHHNWR